MKDDHDVDWKVARQSMGRVAAATSVFALWHSLLCSRAAKDGAKQVFGERRGAAWYRSFFIAQSFPTSGALVLFLLNQPARTLYDLRGAARVAAWLGQAACLWLGWRGLRDLGPKHFSGLESVQRLHDEESIIEPEAQGPPRDENNKVRAEGVYRWSRHPMEWAPIILLWSTPRMKTNWLAFNVLAAIYSLVGALHEEKRLLQKDPDGYAEYQKQVAFLVGKPPHE